MAAPAALPAMPAAASMPGAQAPAPSGATGSDTSGHGFGQQLQAVRHSQSGAAPAPTDASGAPTPDAGRQGNPSPTDTAAKPSQESDMASVGSAPATPTAGAASATPANAPSKANAATNGQAADAALADAALAAVAQRAQPPAATDDAAPTATGKTSTPKAAATDAEGAATLAGAMLAMLGQVNGNMAGAQPDADDGAVSADGSSPGQAKAALLLQGLGANGQASLVDGAAGVAAGNSAPLANFAGMLGAAGNTPAVAGADTQKTTPGLDALAFATAPMPMHAGNVQTAVLPQLQMSSPAGSADFASELGQQVTWLGQQGIQQAKIRLNPQDLGSLDVHVTVNQSRIDVVFSAQHPAAVAAVQQSLPQLDNMLNRHGLSLGHAEVGQQQGGGGHSRGEGGGTPASSADEIGEVQGVAMPGATSSRIGLLDAFA